MCCLRNIAIHDYQESVTTGQSDRQTDAGQSEPYVPLCFAGDTQISSLQLLFGHHFPTFETTLWLRITDEGSVRGMRIWPI